MKAIIILSIFLLSTFHSHSQDRHYWSKMGGITAGLLGGAAISGLKDNSSLYYNAASMSFVNNPSISLGANTYRLHVTNIDNALGKDLNKLNTGFAVNPDLIGGLLFSKNGDKYRFGYVIATRFYNDNSFSLQSINKKPGGVRHVADFSLDNKSQETWIKSANSYKISDHLSLGLSLIVGIKSQTYSNIIGSKLIPASTATKVSRFDSFVSYDYWNVKGLVRLSVAGDYEKFRFGWNVTLPSLNLFGSGRVKREFSIVNNPSLNSDSPKDVILTASDESMSTVHKYPLSSGFGVSFKIRNKNWLHFSSELFLPIKRYKIFSSNVEPEAFPETAFDSVSEKYFSDVTFLELFDQAKFVMNFAVGYESFVTKNWGMLFGLRTDFNYKNADDFDLGELRPYYSNLDIYYVSGGVWGVIKNQKITTGIEFGFSPKTRVRQFVNFDNIDSPDYPLMGTPTNSAFARQISVLLFLGIEINFVK